MKPAFHADICTHHTKLMQLLCNVKLFQKYFDVCASCRTLAPANSTIMNSLKNNKYLIPVFIGLVAIIGVFYYYFFTSFSTAKETQYVYIDSDDNIDSVYTKLSAKASGRGIACFKMLVRHSKYAENINTGRYAIKTSDGAINVYRNLKNGLQASVNLTIPSVRTLDKLAGVLGKKLMLDSTSIINTLRNRNVCNRFGYDTATISCMFIPDTYEVYWNISMDNFLKRMDKESKNFWNFARKEKARQLKLTPIEVITLASIVDEETAYDPEKPVIAGLYYNRLMLRNEKYPNGMPLQADPTIKFAMKKFELHRIYHNMLTVKSPYNTYVNTGLPPGPIRIPTVKGIDAVLNMVRHNYIYMVAKEDFSGKHNFSESYQEHLQNAERYSRALNARNMK